MQRVEISGVENKDNRKLHVPSRLISQGERRLVLGSSIQRFIQEFETIRLQFSTVYNTYHANKDHIHEQLSRVAASINAGREAWNGVSAFLSNNPELRLRLMAALSSAQLDSVDLSRITPVVAQATICSSESPFDESAVGITRAMIGDWRDVDVDHISPDEMDDVYLRSGADPSLFELESGSAKLVLLQLQSPNFLSSAGLEGSDVEWVIRDSLIRNLLTITEVALRKSLRRMSEVTGVPLRDICGQYGRLVDNLESKKIKEGRNNTDFLDYTSFSQLVDLILSDYCWRSYYKFIFMDRNSARETLTRIRLIRNTGSHARPLTAFERVASPFEVCKVLKCLSSSKGLVVR